jgi:hypothetical protein
MEKLTSANVQNGKIWRYQDGAGPMVDNDFNTVLGNTEVRLSQQVIADYGNGSFDVELKVQSGNSVRCAQEEAVVFLLDDSNSISSIEFQQMREACVAMVYAFPSNINVQFGIVAFETNSRIILPLTSDRNVVISALMSFPQIRKRTNLYAGIQDAQTVLNAYTSGGPKHIVLITDGMPNELPSELGGGLADKLLGKKGFVGMRRKRLVNVIPETLNKIAEVKDSGVFVYVAGYGTANPSFFSEAASRSDICQIVNNSVALTGLLTNLDPVSGFLGSIIQNAKKNVAINMGEAINFVEVRSNNGGGYDLTSGNGTLYWAPNPDPGQPLNGVKTLVYRIQIDETKLVVNIKKRTQLLDKKKLAVNVKKITRIPIVSFPTLPAKATKAEILKYVSQIRAMAYEFIPVSSSAVFNYTANGKAYTVNFDIPKVRFEHIHVWGEWEVIIPVTCESDGKSRRVCIDDPSHIETRIDKSYGHIYVLIDHKDATRTEDGYDYYKCSVCGNEYTVLIPATNVSVYSVTPTAYVEKLNGNQNRLFITVTVVYLDGTMEKFEWNGLIDNNAAGTYQVGDYMVYVDTKGNTQIRECYIVETKSGGTTRKIKPIKK